MLVQLPCHPRAVAAAVVVETGPHHAPVETNICDGTQLPHGGKRAQQQVLEPLVVIGIDLVAAQDIRKETRLVGRRLELRFDGRGQLREALLRWLPAELEPDGANENAGASAEPAPLQLSQLTSLVGDDRAKIRRYLELFASSTGTLMGRIGASIDRREAPGLRRLSHTLKGACGNIGAVEMAELARRLEQAAAAEDWTQAGAVWRELEGSFDRTKAMAASI